jgi:hypothetical protein
MTSPIRARPRFVLSRRTALAGSLSIASLLWASGSFTVAQAQPALTKAQAEALETYNKALDEFRSVLKERRAQIDQHQPLPELPGQAIYLARNNLISAYKDLTDLVPTRIGRPSRFGMPPAYFDADNEPLIDEYLALFSVLQEPLPNSQKSDTPYKDVADLGTAIARAKGLDAAHADVAARICMGIFFAETGGLQNMGNARSTVYKGSFQTGPSEDRNGQKKWAAIRPAIAAFDPALIARDDKEQARAAKPDQRFNHWTNVRNALMNEHAEVFPQIPQIVRTLPNPIDQMKVFELIQIIPTPTKAAIRSGDLVNTTVSTPRIMGYLRNNSMFAYGKADRARTSATFREILDAMWLFNRKFEQAIAKHNEIKASKKG